MPQASAAQVRSHQLWKRRCTRALQRPRGRPENEARLRTRAPVNPGAVAVLLALGSCAAPTALAPAKPQPAVAGDAPSDEWATASWEERHDTMTWLVLPNLARKFQAFAGTPYPELSCVTCHGDDAERVLYKMPNGLPALDPAHLPTAHSDNPRQARFATFMIDEVTPSTARLLGKPDVSCFTCHPRAGGG